jgi:hypothetical protein
MPAFPTNANVTTALLQQLNFRGAGNTPISSLYTLYANGHGQTFWSNSVNPGIISSLSTSINNVYTQVEADLQAAIFSTNVNTSTSIGYLSNEIVGISSQISSLTYAANSSIAVILQNEAALSTNVNQISSGINTAFLSTANSFQVQLDSYYQSTMNAMYSTVLSISTVSSFYSQIQSTTNLTQDGLSSLSTALYTQNTSTYTSLTDIFNAGLTSTSLWVGIQISTISSQYISIEQLNNFSTQINVALLSTSDSLTDSISSNSAELAAHDARISSLEFLSSNISTLTYGWISSFYSTNIDTINQYNAQQSTILGSSITSLQNYSTTNGYNISSLLASTNQNIASISSLSFQLSVITTSSILAGIYETFIQLEGYTSSLVNSTVIACYEIVSSITSTSAGVASATQTIQITGEPHMYYAQMDLVNYKNFNIQVFNIAETPEGIYQVGYDPNQISSGLTYQGIITLDISTLGQHYDLNCNNDLFSLDVSRWGIINNQYESIFPMVSDSDYTMEYQYNSLNGILYANLLNIYPRMNTSMINVSSINDNTVLDPPQYPTGKINYEYSSGTLLNVSWSNYIFSTFGLTNIYAQTNVSIQIATDTPQYFGPYAWPISSVIVPMPESTQIGSNIPSLVTTFIVGQQSNVAQFPILYYHDL